MSSGRGRSPCDIGPRELRLDVICPGGSLVRAPFPYRLPGAVPRSDGVLADLGLIDEYEFLVYPVLAGHGPTLLAGLRERIQIELVDRHEFRSGAVALRYRSTRVPA